MLTSFETKSARVKSICFHNTRPLLLVSLYNGVIQLWDYKMCSILERFDEHDGPVRAIDFHNSQPIFVSGGDDYKIKLWNFYTRKCLFTLVGHIDYVRTTFFHAEYPWIISCSDDQTIRIWNWQSRKSICNIAGHNHYVMCAQFHPKEPLVVSCSLDQTIRVWDISGLKRKYYNPSNSKSTTSVVDSQKSTAIDLFVPTDAVVKYVLEGHDRGINYVNFHPTQPLIISCADDRQVKVWRYTDNKAWEVDTCRGHYNNVSMAIFHPNADIIISVSEDKTIRTWDANKRTILNTFRRENDRFWALAIHPQQNIIAAGHDSGVIVFKLERERPPYTFHENSIFYIKDNYIRHFDISSCKDSPMLQLKKTTTKLNPVNIQYNPAENSFIVNYANKTLGVESYFSEYHKVSSNNQNQQNDVPITDATRINSIQSVWIARNKYAVLEKHNQLLIKNISNNSDVKTIEIPNTDNLYIGGIGTVILKNQDGLSIYDIQMKSVVNTVKISYVKSISWSPTNKILAVISKNTITFVNKKLEIKFAVNELLRIKSGVWDQSGKIFLYNTNSHIKYIIVESGDKGIVRTLDVLIYIVSFMNDVVYCLDRSWKPCIFQLDQTEFQFKLALVERRYDEIIQIVKNSNLVGQSLIGYLRQKKYPEVALHFVKDKEIRFALSIECCNLEEALKVAFDLDDKECWEKLGSLAISMGDFNIAEQCFHKLKHLDGLIMLYIVTGNMEKLKKLTKIVESLKDDSCLLRILLITCDVEGMVKFMKDRSFYHLAYHMASNYNLETEKQTILNENNIDKSKISSMDVKDKYICKSSLPLLPLQQEFWPRLNVAKNLFDIAAEKVGTSIKETDISYNIKATGMWDDGLNESESENNNGGNNQLDDDGDGDVEAANNGDGWDIAEDLNIKIDLDINNIGADTNTINNGTNIKFLVSQSSNLPSDLTAVGNFETALKILRDTLGVIRLKPYEKLFMETYKKSSSFVPTLHGWPLLHCHVRRNIKTNESKSKLEVLPISVYNLSLLNTIFKQSMNETTEGKFIEAIETLQYTLLVGSLCIVENKNDHNEIIKIIILAKEYVIGLKMELLRRQLVKSNDLQDQKRACELAAYFTHCQLQPGHMILALRTLMNLAYKTKNYKLAVSAANRLLEMGPSSEVAQQARKVVQSVDVSMKNEFKDLVYDEMNPFVICAQTFKPIYKGYPLETCPLCKSSYDPSLKSSICSICQVSQIGHISSGLRTFIQLNR